jgi:hypothetical protein
MKTSSSTQAGTVRSELRSYAQLQQRIHDDLRVQHPEWIEPYGNCPTCESYERRLAETIGLFQSAQRNLVAA